MRLPARIVVDGVSPIDILYLAAASDLVRAAIQRTEFGLRATGVLFGRLIRRYLISRRGHVAFSWAIAVLPRCPGCIRIGREVLGPTFNYGMEV